MTVAGYAYANLGQTYALGSHQLLGLWNTFTTSPLQQMSPHYSG